MDIKTPVRVRDACHDQKAAALLPGRDDGIDQGKVRARQRRQKNFDGTAAGEARAPCCFVADAILEQLRLARGHDVGRLDQDVDLDAPARDRAFETIPGG